MHINHIDKLSPKCSREINIQSLTLEVRTLILLEYNVQVYCRVPPLKGLRVIDISISIYYTAIYI